MGTDLGAFDDFTERLLGYFTGPNAAVAERFISRYYRDEPFTGRYFDVLRDHEHPDEITTRDLVAVEMLGVQIPASVAIWLLHDGRSEVSELLRAVPDDVDIWDGDELLAPGRELWRLWDLLGEAAWPQPTPSNGMGRTLKSKLLAAKRPRLVPVLDKVVCDALPPVDNYWTAFRTALASPEARLLVSVPTAGAPEQVSLLRRVDVVLWMANRSSA